MSGRISLLVALWLFSCNVDARAGSFGELPCSELIKEQSWSDPTIYSGFAKWYRGYLTGRNAVNVSDRGHAIDLDPPCLGLVEQWQHVWALCQANPDWPFSRAANSVYQELVQ